ncbi:hypothetical protein BDA99DRAFT_533966 [Phascolomyces articulosus]|uniref:GRIP domain-containing protein n=1 Tax=Phascolomyces articulosus TaxID=60185 RepID=A0AAD5K647_9FUNG|nr:hypothetical protein BDA99DRAFT_533966 [Phascolomyces articulosus]
MPNNKKQNQGKQKLQDQVQRLNNELEELQLEREESKKNVLHFMQEADQARQDLAKAQALIAQLSQQAASVAALPISPPLPLTTTENGTGGLVTAHDEITNKVSRLLVKLQQLNDPAVLDQLWDQLDNDHQQQQKDKQQKEEQERKELLQQQKVKQELEWQQYLSRQQEQETKIESLMIQLDEAHQRIDALDLDKYKLIEELSIAKNDQETTRQARDIEHERAETLEKRWQGSENELEQAETKIQSLERELESMRQKQWVSKAPSSQFVEKSEFDAKCKELDGLGSKFSAIQEQYNNEQDRLEQQSNELKDCRKKHADLEEKLIKYKTLENQQHALEQAKIRENHLKTINKTLRDEIRKVSSRNNMEINMEYLKNVIIKFLEKKQTRAQLIPVIATLLQCSREEQLRLNKLVRNKITS